MRGNKKRQLVREQRKELDVKRSAVSKERSEKRKTEHRAEDAANAIQRSPAGKQAAETLTAKRGIARRKQQANYQKRIARASTRMGGRRKQIQAELRGKLEE
jgi:hypothetical protein